MVPGPSGGVRVGVPVSRHVRRHVREGLLGGFGRGGLQGRRPGATKLFLCVRATVWGGALTGSVPAG
ncbi:hypothetical protein SHL15_2041 [Streptomyces hygroscopicus subsp. limoneus]|nr:hypothetical protein SHL15_2041 [Streptomyces hygroscopicus subsp. limoneus]